MAKKNKILLGTVITGAFLSLGIYVGSLDFSSPAVSDVKVSYTAANIEQLSDEAGLILVGTATKKSDHITYEGVDFITTEVKINDLLKGDMGSKKTIKLLQTDTPEDPAIEKDHKTLLFLEKYEGPVTEDAYVVKGLYQGQYKIKDNQVMVNEELEKHSTDLAESVKAKKDLIGYLKEKFQK